jgi:hypothetical protein
MPATRDPKGARRGGKSSGGQFTANTSGKAGITAPSVPPIPGPARLADAGQGSYGMTREQFEAFLAAPPPALVSISVEQLSDRRDRTLLLGYTVNRDTFHVYLQDGLLCRHVYSSVFPDRSIAGYENEAGAELVVQELVPNKRVYPQYCDPEFVGLLRQAGVTVPFTNHSDPGREGPFFAKTMEG